MADTHYELDPSSEYGNRLKEDVRETRRRFSALEDTLAVMTRMKDGDGSQAAHFQEVVDSFGVLGADANAKLVNAKAIYDELNSAMGNSAALLQFLAELG